MEPLHEESFTLLQHSEDEEPPAPRFAAAADFFRGGTFFLTGVFDDFPTEDLFPCFRAASFGEDPSPESTPPDPSFEFFESSFESPSPRVETSFSAEDNRPRGEKEPGSR